MNAVLQIIAKLYPDIFEEEHGGALAQAGRAIVDKIRDDEKYVTRKEAEAFYTALLEVANGKLRGTKQESADECMDLIWWHLGLPEVDATLNAAYVTLGIRSSHGSEEPEMLQLFNDSSHVITPENLRNNIVPIKVDRNSNGTKSDTNVKKVLSLTVTAQQLPSLSQAMACQLVGFIVHSGSATSGHYVAYIQRNGQWKLYNDAAVSYVTLKEVEQTAGQASLYFYHYNYKKAS